MMSDTLVVLAEHSIETNWSYVFAKFGLQKMSKMEARDSTMNRKMHIQDLTIIRTLKGEYLSREIQLELYSETGTPC